ncbi:MAG: acyl-CoA thioesterase [Candidatus Cyclonatronum sp.]|uniref:acyl-CoA thioesterase n=1 Tax=Cyclonatronum sp. TaxID=3024185 RepID=UPI0025BE4512|nr:thioesterase family protein [Cyclonatronum sp.]MCH8485656.1 acyl-CoA thioesterase [Cyclonatronum sp.]
MEKIHYPFEIELDVRDYELDAQGIVNNANYQHYFEHARHQLLRKLNLSFVGLHDDGFDWVVHKVEIDYKRPLRSGDRFRVKVAAEQQGVRFVFYQEIERVSDGQIMTIGKISSVFMQNGRPVKPPQLVLDAYNSLYPGRKNPARSGGIQENAEQAD